MTNRVSLPDDFSQNSQVPIRMVAPDFGHLAPQARNTYEQQSRLAYYFFLFILEGTTQYGIDRQIFKLDSQDLLFALPYQTQQMPASLHGKNYYKLGFDEECLSRLPKPYPFLLNPLNQQKIRFSRPAAQRVQAIFELLRGLLATSDTHPGLILAHLNSLLTEINLAYFAGNSTPINDKLAKFIGFSVFVENNLTEHPSIRQAAQELAVSTDQLNQLVKQYSGRSPKEFINHRLILEARRRLHYGQPSFVKELAYELGFNDPRYFSRLFKKITGKTVTAFFQNLSTT